MLWPRRERRGPRPWATIRHPLPPQVQVLGEDLASVLREVLRPKGGRSETRSSAELADVGEARRLAPAVGRTGPVPSYGHFQPDPATQLGWKRRPEPIQATACLLCSSTLHALGRLEELERGKTSAAAGLFVMVTWPGVTVQRLAARSGPPRERRTPAPRGGDVLPPIQSELPFPSQLMG